MAEKKAVPTDANQSTVSRDKITTSLMVLAAAIAVLGFGTVFSVWFGNGPPDAIETLKIASREYIAGNAIIAGRLAQSVDLGEDLPEDDSSGKAANGDNENEDPLAEWRKLRQFLISAGEVVRARGTDEIRERREILIAAIPDFKAAVEKGLPVGREVDGKRLLAEAYFSLGEFDRAATLFEELITLDPTLRRELLPLLAETLLRTREPKPEIALNTIEAILVDKTLRPEQRFEANLIQIDALTRLGRYVEAEAAIERGRQAIAAADVTKQASYIGFQHRFKLAQGVVQIRKAIGRFGKQPVNPADSREEVIAALAPTMMALLDLQREASPRIASEARIWAGRAYQCQGMPNQALSQWSATRQQRPFGGAAIISGLEEIEQLAALGLGVELVQTIRYMMREMGDLRGFDPTMVSLVEFRRRLIAALEKLRDQSAYQETIDVARSLPPIFTRSAALMQEGIAFREWAASTLRAGTQLNGEVSSAAASLARRRFRQAGDAFTQAAELDFDTTRYIKTQWAAIDSYQQGRHFERSIRLLRSYLRYEERQRQPRGLIAMGRALLAESEPVGAIESLETVIIEYPRDPLRYDARLLMALAYSETGDIEKARAYLIDNLQDGELTPQSPAWRDSLFTLAEILYQKSYKNHLLAEHADPPERAKLLQENQPILDAAIRRLDEAVLRYQPAPRADTAAYLAARSHILAAQWPRLEAQSTDILDAARRAMRTKVETELNAALAGFRDLKERILRREEEQKLTNDAQSLLRNCMMAEADTLKEMGQLEEAATAYRTVSLRYMNQPPALEAILGQARCVRELGRRREADLLIRQASVVLKQIPPKLDGEFKRTTRYDRTGWEKMIAWMTAGMRDPGGGV